jgi:inosose dehydratase
MQRREFLAGTLGTGAWAALGRRPHAWAASLPAVARIQFGYAALTWGGNDAVAIDEVATLGFRGIQLRASAVATWGSRPADLKALLAERKLALVALSSGVVLLDPAAEAENLALHLRHAQFLRDAGGTFLQVVDQRPVGRPATVDDYRRMGRLLSELGRRVADLGVRLSYHNHMGNLGQAPDEVARVLDSADPRFVRLQLDIAHWRQAAGDPAQAVRDYAGRMTFLHLKDLESPVPGRPPESFRFVELGRGKVDLQGVFAALEATRYEGWAVVELDRVPDPASTPLEAGYVAKRFLEGLGYTI